MNPLTLATSHLLSGESSEGGYWGALRPCRMLLSAALEGHCPPLSTFSAWLLRLEVEFIAWSDIPSRSQRKLLAASPPVFFRCLWRQNVCSSFTTNTTTVISRRPSSSFFPTTLQGPVREGDILTLLESEREARRLR
jgi:hypothetical protein